MVNLYPAAIDSDDDVAADESGADDDMEDIEVLNFSSFSNSKCVSHGVVDRLFLCQHLNHALIFVFVKSLVILLYLIQRQGVSLGWAIL